MYSCVHVNSSWTVSGQLVTELFAVTLIAFDLLIINCVLYVNISQVLSVQIMSDAEENDELSELPNSDPFRTAEIQEVLKYDKRCKL